MVCFLIKPLCTNVSLFQNPVLILVIYSQTLLSQELSGALDHLETKLKSTGLHDTAAAVAHSKAEVLGKVQRAADNVSNLVEV